MRFPGPRSSKASKSHDRSSSDVYMLDQLLLPRLKHFSYNNNISDVDGCVDYLRRHYKEYARKQQGPFRKLVLREIHILKQKQQHSSSHTELNFKGDKEDRPFHRESASETPSGAFSDEAHEESFVSGVGEAFEASDDNGEMQSSGQAKNSVRKKRKLCSGGRKAGLAKDSTDEDEVLGLSPAFNMLNSSLRTAYHERVAIRKQDMDGSEKLSLKKVKKPSKHVLEDREPTIVQAFAPLDVIAAVVKAAAAKPSKKPVKQLEGNINGTDVPVLPTELEKVVTQDALVKHEAISGVMSVPKKHDINRISEWNTGDPESNSVKTAVKPVANIQRSEKLICKNLTSVSEIQEKEMTSSPAEAVRFCDLGGIDNVLELIREITFPLYNPGVYLWLGMQPVRGVLLHGPPGCGKTRLANAIAHETHLPFLKISGPEVVSGMSGESEAKVRGIFSEATRLAPCIIFIDEIDSITSKRENAQREMERRIVTQLMACMDELNHSCEKPSYEGDETAFAMKSKHVLVIGATNRPEAVDPALRRPGRFDREISLGVPDENGRAQILSVLARHLRLEGSFDFKRIARCTPGFVGADLAALTREAGSLAIKRIITCKNAANAFCSATQSSDNLTVTKVEGGLCSTLVHCDDVANKVIRTASLQLDSWWNAQWTQEDLHALSITMQDFEEAVPLVQPSTKREGFSQIPNVKWEDVGALDSLQKCMEFYISRRIKHPEDYEILGLDMDAGFLLYGPPGCGKTLVAKAVANNAQANFIYVKGPELLNKYVGESEHAVRALFARSRSCAPCIIFFDEMDALAPRRGTDGNAVAERVLNQLLSEMDGADRRKGVFVIGATNRPDMIDPAVLRPGRIGKLLYVPLPDCEGRLSILKTLTLRKPISSDVDLSSIAGNRRCEGLSGADLAALVNEACVAALQEKHTASLLTSGGETLEPLLVHDRHFEVALSQISPSVSKQDMLYYEDLPKKFNHQPGMKGIASETYS